MKTLVILSTLLLVSSLVSAKNVQPKASCTKCESMKLDSEGGLANEYPRYMGTWQRAGIYNELSFYECYDCMGLRDKLVSESSLKKEPTFANSRNLTKHKASFREEQPSSWENVRNVAHPPIWTSYPEQKWPPWWRQENLLACLAYMGFILKRIMYVLQIFNGGRWSIVDCTPGDVACGGSHEMIRSAPGADGLCPYDNIGPWEYCSGDIIVGGGCTHYSSDDLAQFICLWGGSEWKLRLLKTWFI